MTRLCDVAVLAFKTSAGRTHFGTRVGFSYCENTYHFRVVFPSSPRTPRCIITSSVCGTCTRLRNAAATAGHGENKSGCVFRRPRRRCGRGRTGERSKRVHSRQMVLKPSVDRRPLGGAHTADTAVRVASVHVRAGAAMGIGFSDFSPANAVTLPSWPRRLRTTGLDGARWVGHNTVRRTRQPPFRNSHLATTGARMLHVHGRRTTRARAWPEDTPGRIGLRIAVFFVRFILRPIAFRPFYSTSDRAFRPSISECFFGKLFHLFREILRNRSPVCSPVFLGRDTLRGGVPGRPGGAPRFYPAKISVGPLFIIRYDTHAFQTRRPNLNGFTGFEFEFNIYVYIYMRCKISTLRNHMRYKLFFTRSGVSFSFFFCPRFN